MRQPLKRQDLILGSSSCRQQHGCCIGRTGPAAFAQNLPLQAHSLLADSANVYTGSQWLILSYAFCHELMGPGGPGDAARGAGGARTVHGQTHLGSRCDRAPLTEHAAPTVASLSKIVL